MFPPNSAREVLTSKIKRLDTYFKFEIQTSIQNQLHVCKNDNKSLVA